MDSGNPLFEMMKFQGWLRLYLTQCGIDEEAALTVSGKVLDMAIKSPMVKDEYKQVYEKVEKKNEP